MSNKLARVRPNTLGETQEETVLAIAVRDDVMTGRSIAHYYPFGVGAGLGWMVATGVWKFPVAAGAGLLTGWLNDRVLYAGHNPYEQPAPLPAFLVPAALLAAYVGYKLAPAKSKPVVAALAVLPLAYAAFVFSKARYDAGLGKARRERDEANTF